MIRILITAMAIARVAAADSFPKGPGPCADAETCEKACSKGKTTACAWGGVLVMQSALGDERKERARVLFDKACKKGDGESCFQEARILDPGEGSDLKAREPARVIYDKACNRQHVRACFTLAKLYGADDDAKARKAIDATYKKATTVLRTRCTAKRDANACTMIANIYAGGMGVIAQDQKKATEYRERACQIKTKKPCPPDTVGLPPPPPPPPPPLHPAPAPTPKP